jgi:predicted  nucleic acid-binding Zn-ribbon protein
VQADPSAQLQLLDVQSLDSRADSLRHRLGSLPEAEKLRDVAARHARVVDVVRDLRIAVSDLAVEQRRSDADVEQVKTRRDRDQGMIDSGQVADPKALERMLGELESLRRRISALEDVELEVMERLESAESDLTAREAELAQLEGEEQALRADLDEATRQLRAQLAEVEAERAPLAATIPEDLLALYEKLRAQKSGVGAAALRRRECGGCRLTLNASDLADIVGAPADQVVRCEECNRILVRTAESGL